MVNGRLSDIESIYRSNGVAIDKKEGAVEDLSVIISSLETFEDIMKTHSSLANLLSHLYDKSTLKRARNTLKDLK